MVVVGAAWCVTLSGIVKINADEVQNYLHQVESGETLILTRDGQPIAEVKPIIKANNSPRPFGLRAGEFAVPDDFDAPLLDDILDAFEGR